MDRHVVRLAFGIVLAAVVWKVARTPAPPPAPPAVVNVEPGRLPTGLLSGPAPLPGGAVPASAADPPVAGPPAPAASPPGPAAPGAGKVAVLRVTEKLGGSPDKDVNWGTPGADDTIYLFSTKPTVVLDEDPTTGVTLKVELVDEVSGKKLTDLWVEKADGTVAWAKHNKGEAGKAATLELILDDFVNKVNGPVKVSISASAGQTRPAVVRFSLPQPPAGAALTADGAFNSPHLPDRQPLEKAVDLYGSYLKLTGMRTGVKGDLTFLAQADGLSPVVVGDPRPVAPNPAQADPNRWTYELTLPPGLSGPGATGFVTARAKTAVGHIYARPPVLFANKGPAAALPAPQVALAAHDGDAGKLIQPVPEASSDQVKVYRGNTRKVKLTITNPPPDANAVLVYVDSPTPTLTLTKDQAGLAQVVTLPPNLKNVIKVVAVRGSEVPTNFAVAEVTVRTDRPRVESVISPAFGSGPGGVEKVVVKFSPRSELDPKRAEQKANYEVIHREAPDKADDRVKKIRAAVYDPATETVTLGVEGIVPGSYEVNVKAPADTPAATDLLDVYGNPVQQAADAPAGKVFQVILFTGQAAAAVAVATDPTPPGPGPGVTLTPAPKVVFPEYAVRPEFPQGFNPADRVETRVVRLYYYRDAHRVAQIVNRDVKSYNRATVDVRRRAADRARDDANIATDERKRLEGQAVAAAQDSRQAEKRLRELQDQAQTARTQGAQARVLLNQRQVQIQQAQVELNRAMLDTQAQAGTDARVPALRQQIAGLQLDIERLNGEAKAAEDMATNLTADLAAAQNAAGAKRTARDAAIVELQKQSQPTADLVTARENSETAIQDYNDAQRNLGRLTTLEAALTKQIADLQKITNPTAADLAALQKAQTDLAALQGPTGQIKTATDQVDAARVKLRTATDQVTQLTNKQSNDLLKARLAADQAADEYRMAKTELDTLLARQSASRSQSLQAKRELPIRQAQLAQAQADLDRAEADARARGLNAAAVDPQRQAVAALTSEVATLQNLVAAGERADLQGAAAVDQARQRVEEKRLAESRAAEAWQVQERKELRAAEELFRREVAAAREDPDTYAPGDPKSVDPVLQCSISVIGEGLIQIRGPIKGLNVIRTMINQIDAPAGQVRIAVHTVQVNGERGDRMEKVVANIQRYLDHSRFLTTQSAQMLRNAVVLVASRKAAETAAMYPGCTQAERDARYLYAFFGKDFTDELLTLDSEFLKTGNKLLSLHSMDSTSLSAALFLMALAKNPVRAEILQEFQRMVQTDLPQAEWNYYQAGLSGDKKCEACFDKKFYLLAYNAKFQSLFGFFTAEVMGEDTLTPVQREFVRLAQIFKNRMVTEIQLKQRVLERSLVEERFGKPYAQVLQEARLLEEAARAELDQTRDQVAHVRERITTELRQLFVHIHAAQGETAALVAECDRALAEFDRHEADIRNRKLADSPVEFHLGGKKRPVVFVFNPATNEYGFDPGDKFPEYFAALREMRRQLAQFAFTRDDTVAALQTIDDFLAAHHQKGPKALENYVTRPRLAVLREAIRLLRTVIDAQAHQFTEDVQGMLVRLGTADLDPTQVFERYVEFKRRLTAVVQGDLARLAADLLGRLDRTFNSFLARTGRYQQALQRARAARRPLDEKKLLDMLVDELEDKFIEILEGTRAHTANVDNYIKAVSTALDDDLNTQFYNPAFRKVREASRYWDVTFGQIETTNILTNNRQFAKVNPAATMEFDLPKRNIMLTEGFRSAKALFDEYGALMNDPSFLALAKMYSGVPVAGQFGTGGGLSPVRNVLPGLPTSADELVMAQAGPGRKEFGSALEALIPDPAIYKFETGTGFEIRPVLAPDGQAVVFDFNYMYSTDVREPVRADEKHLGRVKRHFINTAVQLSNYELREVSVYRVALKAARTARGVPLLSDVPGVGVLFRPLPSAESSLQQNLIYSQATIFPTLFDLMGLRYAPAVADFDPVADRTLEFTTRARRMDLEQRTIDVSATRVDDALRTPPGERRADIYRPQITIPSEHPNGYRGPGLRQRDGVLQEGPGNPYSPSTAFPPSPYAPFKGVEGTPRSYPGMLPPTAGTHPQPGYAVPPPGYPVLPPPGYGVPPGPPIPGPPLIPAPPAGSQPGVRPNFPPDVRTPPAGGPGFAPQPGATTVTPTAPPAYPVSRPTAPPAGPAAPAPPGTSSPSARPGAAAPPPAYTAPTYLPPAYPAPAQPSAPLPAVPPPPLPGQYPATAAPAYPVTR